MAAHQPITHSKKSPEHFLNGYKRHIEYTSPLILRPLRTNGQLMWPLLLRQLVIVWHKLQKLEGFARMNLSQLVEIAQKMFNREELDDFKHMTKIMVGSIQEERSGKTRA